VGYVGGDQGWDIRVETRGGICGWRPGVGYVGGDQGWDIRVETRGGICGWRPGVGYVGGDQGWDMWVETRGGICGWRLGLHMWVQFSEWRPESEDLVEFISGDLRVYRAWPLFL
jgi:hypothetical protein